MYSKSGTTHLVEHSLALALAAHKGQKDKAGQPYILHPLRIMSKMQTPEEMSAALLHDVLEDSDMTAEELLAESIPKCVVEAVSCLTKIRNESYDCFIERVLTNDLATKVKIADIEDNLNILRLNQVNDADLRRIAKYHRAWHKLTST